VIFRPALPELRPIGNPGFLGEAGFFLDQLRPAGLLQAPVRVVDHKLQLELVPYGSASFSARGFTPAVLAPHFDRILATIAVVPRRYVLFCGAVFKPLLSEHVTRWHEFHLRKNDGTLTRQRATFANLLLPHHGGYLQAGLAQSWARQGIPMAAYAEEIRARYEDAAQ
jgi:hypothetical protein